MSDDGVLSQNAIAPHTIGSANTTGESAQFVVNNFLGFSGCEPTFLDLNRVPEIFLTLQVVGNDVIPVQYEGTTLGTQTPINVNPNFSGSQCS